MKFVVAVGFDEGRWFSVATAATEAVVAARKSERKQHVARVESKPPNDDDRQAPCDDKWPMPVGVGTKKLTRQIRFKQRQLMNPKRKNMSLAQREQIQAQIDELESEYQQKA